MGVIKFSRHVIGLDNHLGIVCNQRLYIAPFSQAWNNIKHSEYLMKMWFLSKWAWSKSAVPQPSITSSSSAPNSDLTHSLPPGLIPTLLHEELIWRDETNCINLNKKVQKYSVSSDLIPWDLRGHSKKKEMREYTIGVRRDGTIRKTLFWTSLC